MKQRLYLVFALFFVLVTKSYHVQGRCWSHSLETTETNTNGMKIFKYQCERICEEKKIVSIKKGCIILVPDDFTYQHFAIVCVEVEEEKGNVDVYFDTISETWDIPFDFRETKRLVITAVCRQPQFKMISNENAKAMAYFLEAKSNGDSMLVAIVDRSCDANNSISQVQQMIYYNEFHSKEYCFLKNTDYKEGSGFSEKVMSTAMNDAINIRLDSIPEFENRGCENSSNAVYEFEDECKGVKNDTIKLPCGENEGIFIVVTDFESPTYRKEKGRRDLKLLRVKFKGILKWIIPIIKTETL